MPPSLTDFAFPSPAAAVQGMIHRLGPAGRQTAAECCPLASLRGRILAEMVPADRDQPPFDQSAMDGYAVRLGDLLPGAHAEQDRESSVLPVRAESFIGAAPPRIPDEPAAVRIATGAAIPPNADLIIPREHVIERLHASEPSIAVPLSTRCKLRRGEFIRRQGENGRAGERVLSAGSIVSASAVALLAAIGAATPRVYAPRRVAVITLGEELVTPGSTPDRFQVRNSNASGLVALLSVHPWLKVLPPSHAHDDVDHLVSLLRDLMRSADAIVLSGGISAGHRDPVRRAVDQVQAEVLFHGLPQRPGRPILGAIARPTENRAIPLFGLPGNPISTLVTCTRVVLPILASCAGARHWTPPVRLELANPDQKHLDLWWHRLISIDEHGRGHLLDPVSSGDLITAGRSDGFIEVPPGAPADDSGKLPFYPWPT